MQAYDVYLKSKKIDTVFQSGKSDREEVRTSLINHDGYDPGITVRKRREPKTDVIFRYDKYGGNKEVTAVFPGIAGSVDLSTFTVYAHIGQHSTGSELWYRQNTRPATRAEYIDLYRELKGIGYNLQIVKRFTKKHRQERIKQLSR